LSPAEKIVTAYGGKWNGRSGMICCPLHDDKTPSLKVSDHPTHGVDLHCFGGCPWQPIKDELKRQGFIERRLGGDVSPPTQVIDFQNRYKADAENKSALARSIWNECRSARGTIVETYLRKARGLALDAIPMSIRFHPGLQHKPTSITLPCMVAAIQGPDRRIIAIHRTYLREDGAGKSPVSPRMVLGPYAGGAIRFGYASPRMLIGEGVESTLSAMQIFKMSGWAGISTAGLRSVVLPSEVTEVMIAADHDTPDPKTGIRPGIDAAEHAAERFRSEGRRVSIELPTNGAKDFNDVILQGAFAA
jgi:putative DNA primase/helicase